jgi:hypothetical protein
MRCMADAGMGRPLRGILVDWAMSVYKVVSGCECV